MSIKQYNLDTEETTQVCEPIVFTKEPIPETETQKAELDIVFCKKEKRRKKRLFKFPYRAVFLSFFVCVCFVFFSASDVGKSAETAGKIISFTLLQKDKSVSSFLELFKTEEKVQEYEELDTFMNSVPSFVQSTPKSFPESEKEKAEETKEVFMNAESSALPLYESDLSRGGDKLYLNNETTYSIDLEELLESPLDKDLEFKNQGPSVLIVHTHGSECYSKDTEFTNEQTRTTDKSQNVVRVGKELKYVLEQYGISAIHCETLHDDESFLSAYKNSKATIEAYLELYPSIQYVIDVHRDSVVRGENEVIKTMSTISTGDHAQLMLVVGTDQNGANHPFWRDNLRFAAEIQSMANTYYPTLMRPVNLRKSSFNHQVSKGAFILEVGSYGNTLEEAINAVKLFGKTFARTLAENRSI